MRMTGRVSASAVGYPRPGLMLTSGQYASDFGVHAEVDISKLSTYGLKQTS